VVGFAFPLTKMFRLDRFAQNTFILSFK